MNTQQAQTAITISGFVVAGVYGYRKLAETNLKSGSSPSGYHFLIGFGFVFITLAVLAPAAPELAGMFAIMIAVGDMLANGIGLTNDVTGALKTTATAAK